jgi:DNA-binding transcriptional MocR family regulator
MRRTTTPKSDIKPTTIPLRDTSNESGIGLPHINALSVYHEAMAAKISITPGQLFSAKQKFQNFIRLNCGNPWSPAIENAVRTLGDIMGSQNAKSSKLASN